MESNGGGGGAARPLTASRRLLARSASTTASRAGGAGAFVYDGMRPAPLFSSTNFARSLRKAASFGGGGKKQYSADDDGAVAVKAAPPPRRALSSKENTVHELGTAAARGPWEPARRPRRSSSGGSSSPENAGSTRGSAVLRDMMTRRKEEPEKEEAAHRARMLAARLLQWRFANARMEKAMARATAAAENKLFYTWLRVAELRNIQAAKRIVAQRRRQKLKLARLLRPQLSLLASWDSLAKPHADAVDDLGAVLAAACTALPLADGAQGDMESLHEAMFACVGTVNDIEANADMFFATAGVTSSTLEELSTTIKQEVEGLQEAMKLARIVTSLQVQEVSLRANLIQIQAKQKVDMGASVPAIATSDDDQEIKDTWSPGWPVALLSQRRTKLLVRHRANWRRVSICLPREPRLSRFLVKPSRRLSQRVQATGPHLEVEPSLSSAMATTAAAAAVASETAAAHLSPPYNGRRRIGARPRGASGVAAWRQPTGRRVAERQSGRANREQQAGGSVAPREHVSRSSSAAGWRQRGSALRESRSSAAGASRSAGSISRKVMVS
uniref:Uncharacterized protein n=1 Tax=Oryza meridionalis TaxID=40149 RepID=A0A0E0F0V4_9ORYZ